MIIAPRSSLVSKEVNLLKTVFLHELKAESLVPAFGKSINRYLPTHGKLQPEMPKLFLKSFLELEPDLIFCVKLCKLQPFFVRATSPHRAEVDKSCSELYKGPPFGRQLQLGHVLQAEVDHLLLSALHFCRQPVHFQKRSSHTSSPHPSLSSARLFS